MSFLIGLSAPVALIAVAFVVVLAGPRDWPIIPAIIGLVIVYSSIQVRKRPAAFGASVSAVIIILGFVALAVLAPTNVP